MPVPGVDMVGCHGICRQTTHILLLCYLNPNKQRIKLLLFVSNWTSIVVGWEQKLHRTKIKLYFVWSRHASPLPSHPNKSGFVGRAMPCTLKDAVN